MSPFGPLTARHRDALFAVLALALVSAPLWTPALHLDDPTYRYERLRVTIENGSGIGYATADHALRDIPISEEIGCSIADEVRICSFERYLAANHTIPTAGRTNNPNLTIHSMDAERYRYVLLNGTAYETVYVPNRSVQSEEGWYRIDLGLERVPLRDVIRSVSLDVRNEDVPAAVREAAKTGVGKASREVAVPETTIQVENAYYRVYRAGKTAPLAGERLLHWTLLLGFPIVGIGLLSRISARVELTYVGD